MNDSTNNDLVYPEINTDIIRDLMEIGYVAVGRGLQTAAEDIFQGISAARPKSELPIIGLAVTKMNFGDFVSATNLLCKKALIINPHSSIAKCFLGVISHYCGAQDQAKSLLSEVISENADESAVSIAQTIINEIK